MTSGMAVDVLLLWTKRVIHCCRDPRCKDGGRARRVWKYDERKKHSKPETMQINGGSVEGYVIDVGVNVVYIVCWRRQMFTMEGD